MSDRGMNGKEPNNVLLMVRVNPASVLLDEIAYRELEVRLHARLPGSRAVPEPSRALTRAGPTQPGS